jgi:hypothetical protein
MYLNTSVDPEALATAASKIGREWGIHGYVVESVTAGPARSVILGVVSGDGGRFFVGSTRWGNTSHADTIELLRAWLTDQTEEEARP